MEEDMNNRVHNKPLIILAGPTAVGKTELSIKLAKAVNGEIISCDSMQVYKYMDIGTAKISPQEMEGVPHYMIDFLEPDEEFNVVKFQQYTIKYIQQIYNNNRIPILVGGTGFYIQAVLYDIDFTENETDSSYREELEQLAKEEGGHILHDMLQKVDPESAKAIHPNNVKRVIRALEYAKLTGSKISDHNKEQKDKISPYQFCYFVLNRDRKYLYENINKRVDIMVNKGLVEEVKSLLDKGYSKDLVSMQGLGYKEIIPYLEGKCSLEQAIEILKRDTRHFAKRQITWFKREKDAIWMDKDNYKSEEDILADMLNILKAKQIGG
ncbi:MAG: tRNA (adenosine(37)-N6)-dimethylallyltransferase MiaA [Clostridiales bacterium]|jgi:tRNA dimethylallyltransferase|nr:tRNA (adenosine(37)-N6)-dimethylallyltransferase MiaA [Clostridiales bacterium]